jgi:aminopeptidase N
MKRTQAGWALMLAAGLLGAVRAEEGLQCACAARWPTIAPGAGGEARYAPDRTIEIARLALDVTPNFEKRTIAAEATFQFKPIAKPLAELRFDAVDLVVDAVTSSAPVASHQVTDKEIIITFAEPIPAERDTKLAIRYHAQPVKGLFFRVPSNGYPTNEIHLWTQSQTEDARHWFPSHDYPNMKFSSEITCHVPEGLAVISNGRQVSAVKEPATGLVAVRWVQEKPHVNYLLTLVAGRFVTLEDKLRDLPLRFYALPGDAAEAPLTFAPTKAAMEFFEREIGVPYPWAQYGQVVVRDFTSGGMENTTLTTLFDRTLHRADTENITSSDSLVAHELAHQWFGDLVTCKDWSHIWLNEGFATYYASLFDGAQQGRDQFLAEMVGNARWICKQTNTAERAMQWRRYKNAWEQFDYRAYPKGAWVLHMLRSQLGDDLYRRCIKTYLDRHAYGTVVTEDLNRVIEELSGRSFDRFFDQWVFHGGVPELDVAYAWQATNRLAMVSVKQTQKVSDASLLFQFPLTVRFKSKAGTVEQTVQVKGKEEDFYFPLAQEPEIVRIDPDTALLAQIRFKPPKAMLLAQLVDASDMVGRLRAAELLAEKKDAETVAALKAALNRDAFYGVRARCSESLREIHTPEALAALCASTAQPDARARNAVVNDIAGYFGPSAAEALQKVLVSERNPVICATALRGLGPYHEPGVRALLLKYLESASYRQQLAEAAFDAMRAQDDPAFIAPLRAVLAKRETDFVKGACFGSGLDALAWLARNEKNRDEIRNFIAGWLTSPRLSLQLAAMRALGTLEDPQAIALLQTFAGAAKETPEQETAAKAIAALRAVNKPSDNLKDLREELLKLQKDSQRLGKELDEIKKRLDAGVPKPASTNAPAQRAK